MTSIDGALDVASMLAALPVGLAVLDRNAVVRAANDQLAVMLGGAVDDLVGRSLLEFAHPDDLDFAMAVLRDGSSFGRSVLGPVRLRYVDARGAVRFTEFWARDCHGEDGVDGFVVTVAEESAADQLADAVRSIASAEPIEVTLRHVIGAMAANPVVARAAMLVPTGDDLMVVGEWPLPVPPDRIAPTPWAFALDHVHALDSDGVDVERLPSATAAALSSAGIASVWVRPVVTSANGVSAVLVIWQPVRGRPSANQQCRLDDAVAVAALAFDQADHRAALERAVYTDLLTGVGNRGRLAQVATASAADTITGVLYVDLDRFKQVNDRFGHAVGDEILALVGTRLAGVVRGRDEVIRVGGDEFVVLCRTPAGPGGLDAVAERVERVLSEPYSLAETTDRCSMVVRIGASVGVTAGDVDEPLLERIAAADRAMYAVKLRRFRDG